MGMIDLNAISFCINNLRCRTINWNPIHWQRLLFLRLASPCLCLAYDRTCRLFCVCIFFSFTTVSGCGTTAIHQQSHVKAKKNPETARELVSIARSLLGVPYRWGGTSKGGMDCSGLVQYAHLKVGIDVPRNSQDQMMRASPVHPAELHPGDLVFFKMSWRNKSSHVGIYTGDGQFIHAPSSGRPVSYASLHDPFWKNRLVAAGRFY